jgi:hypothetical protein
MSILRVLAFTGALLAAAPLAAAEYGFAGYSSDTIGSDEGMLAMHAECQADYGATARMCTSREFWLSPNAVAPADNAWLHPEIIAIDRASTINRSWEYAMDFTGQRANEHNLSCRGWTLNNAGQKGFVVTPSGKPGSAFCGQSLRVTCCAPVP